MGISPQLVVEAGALNLPMLTTSPATLIGLRKAYSIAISATMICATVTICVSILATFGMRWVNLVQVSRQREAVRQTDRPFVAEDTEKEETRKEGTKTEETETEKEETEIS